MVKIYNYTILDQNGSKTTPLGAPCTGTYRWFATNPWRSKKTMAWRPCWSTKQKVLSTNMATSFPGPLLHVPGSSLGCEEERPWEQDCQHGCHTIAVFQIPFKVRESMKNFEGSIGVVLSNFLKLIIHFVGSASQLCQVFDLRPLSYLEHCIVFWISRDWLQTTYPIWLI